MFSIIIFEYIIHSVAKYVTLSHVGPKTHTEANVHLHTYIYTTYKYASTEISTAQRSDNMSILISKYMRASVFDQTPLSDVVILFVHISFQL